MWTHTTIYVSSYYYICVRILLYMCPHTACSTVLLLLLLTAFENYCKKKKSGISMWAKRDVSRSSDELLPIMLSSW
jgi:hypothetical protein